MSSGRISLFAFLFAAGVTAGVAWIAPGRYETLDDVMIQQLLLAGEESVFFGLIPGRLVRGLLQLSGQARWTFPVLLLALNTFAFALVYRWAFLHGRSLGRAAAGAIALIALAFQVRFTVQFTFTTTAAVLASAVLLVLAGRDRPFRPATAFALGLLLGFAWLIRSESGKLALLVAAPGWVWILVRERRWPGASGTATLLGFLALLGAEQLLLARGTSVAYRDYLAFNAVRGRLHMFDRLYARRNFDLILRENRWSETDYEMFATWLPADERVYSVDTLGVVDRLTALTWADRLASLHPEALRTFVRRHADALAWLALFGGLGFALRSGPGERDRRVFLALTVLAVAALLLTLHLWMRLPRRVSDPAVWGAALTTLALLRRGQRPGAAFPAFSPRRMVFLAPLALLAGGLHARTLLTLRADNRENQARIDRHFEHFTAHFPGKILFLKTNGHFEPAHDNPFRDRREPFERLSFTWMTQSPFFYATLRRLFGIETGTQYFPALVDDPRVVFVCQPEFTALLPRHLRERHGVEARFEEIAPPFEAFRFYRLTTRP
jgi:hypothetical protein